jgi:hypothetical protein
MMPKRLDLIYASCVMTTGAFFNWRLLQLRVGIKQVLSE